MSKDKFTEQAFAFLVDELGFSCDGTKEDGRGFGAVTIYRRGLDVIRIGTDSDWRDPEYSVVVNGKKVFSLFRGWGQPGAPDPPISKLRKLFTDRRAKDIRVLSVTDYRQGDGDTVIIVGKYEEIDVFPDDRLLFRINDVIICHAVVKSAKVSHGNQAIIVTGVSLLQLMPGAVVSRIVRR